MKKLAILSACGTVLFLSACASTPMGPTVRALPGKGKPFDQFQYEQSICKQYAYDQVRDQAERANETAFLQGLGGTVLGTGLGAAIGGGRGAAIGAASGATAGTVVGASTSSRQQQSIQQQYNDAYVQCMVAKGNLVERPSAPAQTTVIYQQTPPPPPPPPTVVYTPAERPVYYGQ